MEKSGYRFVGNNAAVKICGFTKKGVKDEDYCYKKKFYGINSHRCVQMTPSMICPNRCTFCWRDTSTMTGKYWKGEIDDPREIIEGAIEQQRKLLEGFKGNKNVSKKQFEEAMNPIHFAISLTGEPTMYPKIKELIKELHKMGKSSFLVTSGQFPERIAELDPLPTQLYISVDAPNEKVFEGVERSQFKNGWERLNKSLKIMSELKTRRVVRITLVKGINDCDPEGYVGLIKKGNPDFVEVKGYMFIGHSRERLEIKNMPSHEEVKEFAKKICALSGLKILDEKENSSVCLLAYKDTKDRFLKFE